MKKIEKLAAELSFAAELARQDVTNNRKGIRTGSTASHCKKADYAVRDYLMAKGVGSTDDVHCRPGDKHDWDLVVRRVRIVGETKVGEGAVRYAKCAADLDFDPANIYPDVDYIAYCAEPRKLKAHPERKGELFRVFTREQFIGVLTDCGKGGLTGSLRIHQQTTGTWQLEIKAWVTSQCCARLAKYEDWVSANKVPTLEEFRRVLRG
jgi:hypothetical protein